MWGTDRHRFRDQRADGGRRIGPGGDRRPRSPLKFFLLVFAFSVPFWLIGAVIDVQCLPGVPFSSLSAFCPLLAALVLVFVASKTAGVGSGYAIDPMQTRCNAQQAGVLLGLVTALWHIVPLMQSHRPVACCMPARKSSAVITPTPLSAECNAFLARATAAFGSPRSSAASIDLSCSTPSSFYSAVGPPQLADEGLKTGRLRHWCTVLLRRPPGLRWQLASRPAAWLLRCARPAR